MAEKIVRPAPADETLSHAARVERTAGPKSLSDLPIATPQQFTLLGEHARGGMGRVLAAHDQVLDRPVAIKELLSERPDAADRFVREAMVTARLQHPAIVPVYQAGRWPSGEPFYAMKMVTGRALRDVIAEKATLRERLALVPHVIAVADAVAYAHSQKVIHRDLKPSNVLLGEFGETVVVDWGLAKILGTDDEAFSVEERPPAGDLTVSGSVMGTPQYMPPEQARGEVVDERADVYALGAILYAVLAGRPAYDGSTWQDVLAKVLAGPPVVVEERQPAVPADLAAVVGKAMARDPDQRYPTAKELAEDLRRFQTGQLVSSHRYRLSELAFRFARRHAVALAVASALLTALAIIAGLSVRRIARERAEARRRYDEMLVAQARTAVAHDPTEALGWLGRYPLDGSDWSGVRTVMSEAESSGVARLVFRDVHSAALAPDGRSAAILGNDGNVVLATPGGVRQLGPGPAGAFGLAFAPDGSVLVALGAEKLARWDTASGRELPAFAGRGGDDAFGRVIWSRDGRWVAASAGNDVLVWSTGDGQQRRLTGHVAQVHELAFAPAGERLASSSHDGTVRVWDLATGSVTVLHGHQDQVRPVDFSPDGRLLLSAGNDGTVRVWDVASGSGRIVDRHDGNVYGARFSPDGAAVLSVGADAFLRWAPLDGGPARVLDRGRQGLIALAVARDGRRVITAGGETAVRITDVTAATTRLLLGHESGVPQLQLSDDGAVLLSVSDDATARVWDLARPAVRALVTTAPGPQLIATTADGRHVFVIGTGGELRWCDLGAATCRVIGNLSGVTRQLRPFPRGDRVATCSEDGTARIFGPDGPEQVFTTASKINDVAVAPDGRHLALVEDEGSVTLWDPTDGSHRVLGRHRDRAWSVAFSPDGASVLSGGLDGAVQLYDVEGGGQRVVGEHRGWILAVAFSHDGRQLACADYEGAAHVWDRDGGQHRMVAAPAAGAISGLAFSPDDGTIALFGNERALRLWDLASGKVVALIGYRDAVVAARFAPDGRSIAALGSDGEVRMWDLEHHDSAVLRFADDGIYAIAWSAEGLVAGTRGGRVWLWSPNDDLPPRDPPALRARLEQDTTLELDDDGAFTAAAGTDVNPKLP